MYTCVLTHIKTENLITEAILQQTGRKQVFSGFELRYVTCLFLILAAVFNFKFPEDHFKLPQEIACLNV